LDQRTLQPILDAAADLFSIATLYPSSRDFANIHVLWHPLGSNPPKDGRTHLDRDGIPVGEPGDPNPYREDIDGAGASEREQVTTGLQDPKAFLPDEDRW